MSTNYIPNRDTDLITWADNFAGLITGSPTTYGLVAGDATSIQSVVDAFDAAYALAVGPTTRTPATITAKDDAKIAMLAVVRPFAQLVANNAGVSPSLKVGLGINPRTNSRTPITNPTTYPVITPTMALPLQHVLRYRDYLSSPTVKAKPAGVLSLQLFRKVSATPITDPAGLEFDSNVTKAPFLIEFDSADAGKVCYYAGRWCTRTGLVGPWSAVSSMTVAA